MVAVYTRISRDELGEGLGVQRQEEDCRALAARHGWTVDAVYCDNDVSAFSGRQRPAYQALLDAIAAGEVSGIIAWAPERLHRSPRELEDFLELIDRHQVRVDTVKAGAWDVSSSHGRLVARMLGAVSRAESERTGERVSRAHQQAMEQGKWRGAIPLGLRAGSQPGLPVVDEAQAPIVREIFQRILTGEALTRIAADLNARGSRPRRGTIWTHSAVLRLVNSPALGGLVAVDDDLIPAAFSGVVAPDTWRQAQAAIRARPRGETRRPREQLTLLGGILACAEHGHPCFGGSATHGAVYVATGPGRCNVSITRRAADTLLTELVLARLSRPDAESMFRSAPRDDDEAERVALRARRTEIAGLVADGLLPMAVARDQLRVIADRLAAYEALPTPSLAPSTLFTTPATVWPKLTQPQRRAVIRQLFTSITLAHVGSLNGPRARPARIVVEWATTR